MKQHLQNMSARVSNRSYSQSNFTHTSIKIMRSGVHSKDGGSQIAMVPDNGDDSSEGSEFDYVKLLNLGGGSNSSQQRL